MSVLFMVLILKLKCFGDGDHSFTGRSIACRHKFTINCRAIHLTRFMKFVWCIGRVMKYSRGHLATIKHNEFGIRNDTSISLDEG